jgi:putative selenate reductase molybdopterin-binding subunit
MTPIFDPIEAMRDDAPKVHDPDSNIYATKVIKKGDVDKAFADADHIFEDTFTT